MEILLSHDTVGCKSFSDFVEPVGEIPVNSYNRPYESVKQVWDARDRDSLRASEHVGVTGPSAKEAESWA
jgi:hypothetical protein